MAEYYDREGNALTLMEWAKGYENGRPDKRVAEATLPNGRWVSTVWLGLNHQFGDGPPLIFETMVFDSSENMSELDCDRYSTEIEALAGHQVMVKKWTAESPDGE